MLVSNLVPKKLLKIWHIYFHFGRWWTLTLFKFQVLLDPLLSLPALVLSRPGLLRQSLPLRGTWCHIDDDHGVGVLLTFLGGGQAQTWKLLDMVVLTLPLRGTCWPSIFVFLEHACSLIHPLYLKIAASPLIPLEESLSPNWLRQ